ncbi:MAG: hypothetical protein JO350_06775 [Candidatus Eremiobacteraeota bacterium]|nr:hypothetical protein [Candidatus Eremiobacteraeota bacterium]
MPSGTVAEPGLSARMRALRMNLSRSNFELDELAKNAKRAEHIDVKQSFGIPGGVRWDDLRLVVGDVYGSVVYRFKVRESRAIEVGSSPLDSAVKPGSFGSPTTNFSRQTLN